MPYGMEFHDISVPYRRIFIDAPRRVRLHQATCKLCARAFYTTDLEYCSARCDRFVQIHFGREYFGLILYNWRVNHAEL